MKEEDAIHIAIHGGKGVRDAAMSLAYANRSLKVEVASLKAELDSLKQKLSGGEGEWLLLREENGRKAYFVIKDTQ